jgi:hypothetical protein
MKYLALLLWSGTLLARRARLPGRADCILKRQPLQRHSQPRGHAAHLSGHAPTLQATFLAFRPSTRTQWRCCSYRPRWRA